MKPRNREINIFNLSMLDVISGAMGAFLIMMVILLPYYRMDSRTLMAQLQQERETRQQAEADLESRSAELAQAQQQLQSAEHRMQEAEQQLQQAQQQSAGLTEENQRLRAQVQETYIMIHIRWETSGDDVDLHVQDAAGQEFSYQRPRISGRNGELTADARRGPGSEVWLEQGAPPGVYRVYYNLFAKAALFGAVPVSGAVYWRDGRLTLPPTTLSTQGNKVLIATLQLDAAGNLTMQ